MRCQCQWFVTVAVTVPVCNLTRTQAESTLSHPGLGTVGLARPSPGPDRDRGGLLPPPGPAAGCPPGLGPSPNPFQKSIENDAYSAK